MAKAPSAKWLASERRAYLDSIDTLTTQWAIGPLEGHRGCCRIPGWETDRLLSIGAKVRTWQFASGYMRCKSTSCLPDSIFGCAQTNARHEWAQNELIMNGWLAAGHSLYVMQLETRGEAGLMLASVMEASQLAMKRALGRSVWSSQRDRLGISGQISTISAARGKSGSWIVRRWIVLGTEEELSASELALVEQGLHVRWQRSLASSYEPVRGRSTELVDINESDVAGISRSITGYTWASHPAIDEYIPDPRLVLKSLQKEESPADLSRRYRSHKMQLEQPYEEARENYLARRANAVQKESPRSFVPDGLPAGSLDFIDYAVAMFRIKKRSVNLRRNPRGTESLWNELVKEARKLKPKYIEVPISEAGREGKPNKK